MSTGKLPTKILTTIANSEFLFQDNEHDIFISSRDDSFAPIGENKSDSAEKKSFGDTRCDVARVAISKLIPFASETFP